MCFNAKSANYAKDNFNIPLCVLCALCVSVVFLPMLRVSYKITY